MKGRRQIGFKLVIFFRIVETKPRRNFCDNWSKSFNPLPILLSTFFYKAKLKFDGPSFVNGVLKLTLIEHFGEDATDPHLTEVCWTYSDISERPNFKKYVSFHAIFWNWLYCCTRSPPNYYFDWCSNKPRTKTINSPRLYENKTKSQPEFLGRIEEIEIHWFGRSD